MCILCKTIKNYYRLLRFLVLECLSVTSAGGAEYEPCWRKKNKWKGRAKRRKHATKQTADGRIELLALCALAQNCTPVCPSSLKPVGFSILGCQWKLDWQSQLWFFHGQNLLHQMSYKRMPLGLKERIRTHPTTSCTVHNYVPFPLVFVLYEWAQSLPQGQPENAEDGADSLRHQFS